MQKTANRVSLGAVHTHTHTHTSTFKKIRRVANEAALFGIENRLFVALYEGKNKVLEIACFSCRRKFIPVGEIFVEQKGCQDYGHQVVSVMLSCNGITLNYAVILYDKSRSKIQIVQEIAEELPAAPVISYFLCDSWYTTAKVMDRFIRKGFYTVGALKTNRILFRIKRSVTFAVVYQLSQRK